ncbi:MAG: phosphonate ABC transporter ATP-binding protein [Candidatus Cloacimonetes bacterium]|jgi:phosphonate transport system ATP-binding protein|nr:phosphonate ABC transporter ATP-binding protein [Candidatus Cloacimonadota bacterium]MDD3143173.1 phosphonate ABC transporter ATP-binding protein [Candidatus Cloacimonadota bacterium]MDY0366538.1 phosphonate ABC transporter ATP-binding protein [Candidatus Syntrophosphaera sp.]HOY84380.1 phosphonate ABC transporter ATP-binding protein [Candidatus Syntrophosphaera sp.]HPH60461.1 phosphonate ABC transporter ATP-binding protein [Candidatus Syntrophosphaera sp.]
MTQLEIKDLRKSYDQKVWALDKVSFEVQKGDFIILLGLSGSGKSTLLRCINRLIEPDEGDVLYEGNSVRALSPTQLRRYRRNIAMVFQQFNLVKNLSVLTNVLTGRLGYHGLVDKHSAAELEAAHHNLGRVGLKDYAKRQVKNLSGGQQQRVAIARALMQNPAVILADEPVASLDPATADSIMQYLGEINSEGITVLCSLHFLSLARRYGNRVIALKDGLKVYEGLPAEIDNTRFKQIYGQDAEEI